jgi:hypothetical protein
LYYGSPCIEELARPKSAETRNLSFDKAVIRRISVSFCLAPGLIIPLWIMTNGPLQRIEA